MKIQTALVLLSLASALAAANAASADETDPAQVASAMRQSETASHGASRKSVAADPARIVLSRADFPSSTKYTWARMPAAFARGFEALGVKANAAYYSAELSRSSTKYESVQGLVVTTGSATQAKAAYRAIMAQLQRASTTVLRLPAHGDEQVALYQSPRFGSKAELLVRRNSVVWQVQVSGEGLLVIPKAKLLAELKKYAAKQKARVGTG